MRPESTRNRSYGAHLAKAAPGLKPEVLMPHLMAMAADVRTGLPVADVIAYHSLAIHRTLKEANRK